MEIKVFYTSLGEYNNGILSGEWITLPVSDDELHEVKCRISPAYRDNGNGYDEFFIMDWESDLPGIVIGEYDNISELNELAAAVADMDECEAAAVEALLYYGYDYSEIIANVENCYFYPDCADMSDVAYQVVEECGYLDKIPENLQFYFNYEAFGRDLGIEGRFYYSTLINGYVEVVA